MFSVSLAVQRRKESSTEKEATRQQDALSEERRKLPMVKIEKDYIFEGDKRKMRLVDLFEDRQQLIIYQFMFGPTWDKACVASRMVMGQT